MKMQIPLISMVVFVRLAQPPGKPPRLNTQFFRVWGFGSQPLQGRRSGFRLGAVMCGRFIPGREFELPLVLGPTGKLRGPSKLVENGGLCSFVLT